MNKVIILGPVYPWRGGIAHHTNEFVNTILKTGTADVSVISFSRQYPSFLYPGKGQKEPDKTPNNPINFEPQYIFNPINPFTWFLTAHAIVKQKPSYLVIKYWHPFFAPAFTVLCFLVRKKSVKTVCIVDNLLPHERHFGDTWLTRLLFSQIDQAITQSEIVSRQFQDIFPAIPSAMIPHPLNNQFGPIVPQEVALEQLKLPENKTLLLFFGFIRPYKGLDNLLTIFPQIIQKIPNAHLIIAGECFGSFQIYQNIIDSLGLKNHVTTRLFYIPSTDIPVYFGACDLLVMPYRHITNSGIESIASVYSKRFLLTVGVSNDELLRLIIESINQNIDQKKGLSWESYVDKVFKFINHHA